MDRYRLRKLIGAMKRPPTLLNFSFHYFLKRRFIHNPFPPTKIQIEPTTRCNLRCLSCSRSTYSREMIGDMSFENFKKIIDQLPYVLHVKIQGMGEPFLHKDIVEMLKYCKQKKITTDIVSNGTIVNNKVMNYLDRLFFSVDGGSKETYETLRPGSNFELTISNIKEMVSHNKATFILLCIIVSNKNIHELKLIVDLAKSLRVDGIYFGPVDQWVINQGEKREQIYGLIEKGQHATILKAVGYARELGLKTSYNPNRDYVKTCLSPWQQIFVTYDGYVTPCCIRPDKRVINFGNLLNEPFHHIWNNEQYKHFRLSLKENKPTIICRNCPN